MAANQQPSQVSVLSPSRAHHARMVQHLVLVAQVVATAAIVMMAAVQVAAAVAADLHDQAFIRCNAMAP